jgi:Heterokaryon incompatibility protein (HET)
MVSSCCFEFLPLRQNKLTQLDSPRPWPAIAHFSGTRTSQNAGSEASFQLVRRWIANCRRDHDCSNEITDPPLPTRVLDVSGATLKLVSGESKRSRYICLSHRWGQDQIVKTTHSNINNHYQQILWDTLSKTFQDAVSFCRRLGIAYLWIDSLCIVQDVLSDWQREALKMASIYRQSYLTLCATRAVDGTSGLFTDTSDCMLKGSNSNEANFQIFARQSIKHMMYEFDAKSFPLLERGWVYQERFLSPRVLHFGPHELVWECTEEVDCECGKSKSSPLIPQRLSIEPP